MPGLPSEAAAVASAPVKTVNSDLPYYTLITSGRSVDPGVIDPSGNKTLTPSGYKNKRIGGTVEKAWNEGGKQTTDVAKKMRDTGLILGGMVLTAGVTTPVLTSIGMTGTAAGAAGGASALTSAGMATSLLKAGGGLALPIILPRAAEEITSQSTKITDPNLYKEIQKPNWIQAKQQANKDIWTRSKESKGVVDDIVTGASDLFFGLPGINQWANAGKYQQSVNEFYLNKGYSPSKAKWLADASTAQNKITGIWDFMGSLALEMNAERIANYLGKRTVGNVVNPMKNKQAGNYLFKRLAPVIFTAGAYEAGGETIKSNLAKHEEIKPFEINKYTLPWTDMEIPLPGGVAGNALLGGGFAGLFGGAISRFKITKPKLGKWMQYMGYGIDPLEGPGDFFSSPFKHSEIRIPILTPTSTNAQSNTQTQNNNQKKKSNVRKKDIPNNPLDRWMKQSGIFSWTPTNTPSQSNTPSHTNTNNHSFTNIFTPTNTNTNTNTESTTPTHTEAPIPTLTDNQTFTETYSDTNTETDTETETNTNTPTWTNTNIPTFTPIQRIPPPMLPWWTKGDQGSGSKTTQRSSNKYYNELMAALSVAGFNPMATRQQKKTKQTKKRSHKKQPSFQFTPWWMRQ
jgi:hypothetical protein